MELLDAVEVMVKNPLLDTVVVLDELILSKGLMESYKSSDTHKIRELIADKKNFSDMSHVTPYSDTSHVFQVKK